MIDHIIYAAPDLDRAIVQFTREYGVTPLAGGRHIGLGTRNALVGLRKRCISNSWASIRSKTFPEQALFLTGRELDAPLCRMVRASLAAAGRDRHARSRGRLRPRPDFPDVTHAYRRQHDIVDAEFADGPPRGRRTAILY
ncbi:MAG: VOC family protein [Candidatus Eremiobacteraeota bacterium]|nr:VOC family protein [Candidatus Eremiobacteraeota bacterium]